MTRALISEDSIARQNNAGPVQLGYVASTLHDHSSTSVVLDCSGVGLLTVPLEYVENLVQMENLLKWFKTPLSSSEVLQIF